MFDGQREHAVAPICCSFSSHSHACLFSFTAPRPLPSSDLFDSAAYPQQIRSAGSSQAVYLPGTGTFESQCALQPPAGGLADVRSSLYGIQTSNVRESPTQSWQDRDTASAVPIASRGTNESLARIQTTALTQLYDNLKRDKAKIAATASPHQVSDSPVYPSPSSTTGVVVYDSSPLEAFSHRRLSHPDRGSREHSGMWTAIVESSQTLSKELRLNSQALIGNEGMTRSNAFGWYPYIGSGRGSQTAPSCFTSSDIEMASSVDSLGDDEDNFSATLEQEMTITLGGGHVEALHPASVPLNGQQNRSITGAVALDSACASSFVRSDVAPLPRSSTESTSRHAVPAIEVTSDFDSATPRSSPSTTESGGSGSDYDPTMEVKRPKPRQRQVKTSTKKKATTSSGKTSATAVMSVESKRRRRSGQRMVSLDDVQERTFRCEFCPMSFHRRHDMNVSGAAHH